MAQELPLAAATFTATNDSQVRPVITVQVLGIVKTSGCASTIEEGPGLWAESLNTTPGKSKSSVGCCPKSHKSHQCRSPARRRWLAIGPVTSSSSALRLAKSSAGGILSFAVGRSQVAWACSRECQRQAARLSFMRSSHSLKIDQQTHRGRKKRIKRLSAMWPCWCFKATDSKIYGERTNNVTCSSITMSTQLWEYAQVTKDDLSPQTATLLPVKSSTIFCKRGVNEVLEYGAPWEF